MKHGLKQLESDFKKLDRNIGKNSLDILRETAIAVTANIIKGTPVDTGKARGNWQTSIDNPITSIIEREDKSGQLAISELGGVAAKITSNNTSIDVTNNLPYINRLNNGWSDRADAGYIERAITSTKIKTKIDGLIIGKL